MPNCNWGLKDCRACKSSTFCIGNYCDAVTERIYNIRDGKDCWEPILVSMKSLKCGNVFEKDGYTEVAISDAYNGYIWVTKPEYYNEEENYSYTSAACIPVEDIDVVFLAKKYIA